MKNDPLAQMEEFMKDKTFKELGAIFANYLIESNHNNWDGHNRRDLTGIRHLFQDMMLFKDGMIIDGGKIDTLPIFTGATYCTADRPEDNKTT